MTATRRGGGVRTMASGVALLVIAAGCSSQTASPPKAAGAGGTSRAGSTAADAGGVPAVESGLLPWSLAAPVSRSVVLPATGTALTILGGLTAGNSSAAGVYSLDTASGQLSAAGQLPSAVHDAAGAVVAGRDVVFGGGSPVTTASVQSWSPPGSGAVLGSLPRPRSDAAAVTIGRTTYIVGGYDGTAPDAAVLATTDGRHYTTVASLPVPVRYPAVASAHGRIYVFGGQAITGAQSGAPVSSVQMIEPTRHRAAVIAHLPERLAGAAAVTLHGHVYVVGGDSSSPQPQVPGVGTTQVAPSAAGAPGGPATAITDGAVVGGTRRGPHAARLTAAAVSTSSTIWAFEPHSNQLVVAGRLQVPVSHAGVAVLGSRAWVVGGETDGAVVASVQMLTPNAAFGTAGSPGAGSPYYGYRLLVADRGNNRLLLFDAAMRLVWSYPSPKTPADPLSFYFPDDAFFTDHGRAIISNQEQNETIVELAFPSGRVIWSYGHAKTVGTAPGYLNEPDDAYVLPDGQITVADAQNCRVLVLNRNGTVASQIGTDGQCVHNPPASMGSPNGDTPLRDGNLLVSEINGSWVSEYTKAGHLVWTTELPIAYPSDPQQLAADRYLIADYATPGQILEFDRQGQILYRYDVGSGPGMLDHPSLVERLPSGVFMANDDYNDRMVAIDPATGALVWQYGVTARIGTGPGLLNTPDGFDLLGPGGSTPTHPFTG